MFDTNYLFDSSKFNGVVLLLDNKWNIVKVNDYFLTLQGYERKEVENNSILNFILPTDKSIYFDMEYSTQVTKEFVSQMYHKNGSFRFFSFTAVRFEEYSILFGSPEKKKFKGYYFDNTQKAVLPEEFIVTTALDVTEIFKGNKSLSSFIDIFPSDIWVKDKLGRYIYVNSIFESHTGHTLIEVRGKDDFKIFPKKVATEFTSSDQIAIKSRKKINYIFESKDENLLRWTSVSKIPLYNSNNTYIGILGYSIDITEFKNIEQKQKCTINNYRKSINTYFDIAFSYSKKGMIGSIFGSKITEANLNDFKSEISNVFNLINNNVLKKGVDSLENKELFMLEMVVFDTLYKFTFIHTELSQEYDVYVMGKQVEE